MLADRSRSNSLNLSLKINRSIGRLIDCVNFFKISKWASLSIFEVLCKESSLGSPVDKPTDNRTQKKTQQIVNIPISWYNRGRRHRNRENRKTGRFDNTRITSDGNLAGGHDAWMLRFSMLLLKNIH